MITKLLILNKNVVNNIETAYTIDENFIMTDNYNETLDSVNCRISHLSSEIDIEVGDYAWLRSDNLQINKYYMVQNYVLTQDTIGIDNQTYSYDITLCSQTKDMEGCICPNLAITPLRTGQKRSIYWYLNLYNNLYGKKRRISVLGNRAYVNQWTISQEVISKFSSIDAPEMQWNAPTLREVFNDLMMVADCIPIINDNVIKYIDLTQKKDQITQFNFIQRSQDIDSYASELKMDMQNVLQTNIDNIRNTITTTEYLTFKSSDYLITSENIHLETTYPILRIKHFWMGIFVPYGELDQNGQTNNARLVLKDLMDLDGGTYIKEYQEYITLGVAYKITDVNSNWNQWQNYCVYYNRGGNEISGFSKTSKVFLFATSSTIELLKERIVMNLTEDDTELYALVRNDGIENSINSYFSTFFKIEYETMTDQVFSASKDGAKNKRTVVDNQTNSWVDAYTQGNLEYQKANRLGNQTIMFNQRVTNIDDAIKIGDYYTETKNGKTYDIVIYQTQYQVHRDHIEVNAYGTKDYILRNYWTGINSKIRTWVNARDEALVRHELEKYYCGLSFTQHNEIESIANGYDLGELIGESLVNDSPKSLKYAIARMRLDKGIQPEIDMINSVWTFKTLPTLDNTSTITFLINFSSNNKAFVNLQVTADHRILYVGTGETIVAYNSGWNSSYKTITITGGVHLDNDYFLGWLETNATLTSSDNYYYQTEMISRIIGNSYVFTAGYNDNYEVGRSVKTDGDVGIDENDLVGLSYIRSAPYNQPTIIDGTIQTTDGLGGIPTQPLKYTNNNGEFKSIEFIGFADINLVNNEIELDISEQKELMLSVFKRPLIYKTNETSSQKFKIQKEYYKDNKEIFKMSVQFELFNEDDIMFTNYFLRNNSIIQDDPQAPNIKIYSSATIVNGTTLPNDASYHQISALTRTKKSNVVSEFELAVITSEMVGNIIYITDANDNVMVRLDITNHKTETTQFGLSATSAKFYINILKDKDYSYYNVLGRKEGEI